MDVCLLWVLCVYRALRRADHSSRGVLPTVVCRHVWSRNLMNEEAMTHWGLLRQKRKKGMKERLSFRSWHKPCSCDEKRWRRAAQERGVLLLTAECPFPALHCSKQVALSWNKVGFVCVRGIGSVSYENKFLQLFTATFSFMYDAKQSKAKQKTPCGDFWTQIIVSSENFDDVRCEHLLRMLVVWGVTLGWLTFASYGIHYFETSRNSNLATRPEPSTCNETTVNQLVTLLGARNGILQDLYCGWLILFVTSSCLCAVHVGGQLIGLHQHFQSAGSSGSR